MTTHPDALVTAVSRDAGSVLRGPLPAEVSMAPVVSGARFAREDVIADTGREFFAVWACDAGVYPRVKDRRGSFMYLLDGAGQIVNQDGTGVYESPGVHQGPGDGGERFTSRFTYVIAGEARVTGTGGVSAELTAGSAIALPAGWFGTWRIRIPLRTFDVFAGRLPGAALESGATHA